MKFLATYKFHNPAIREDETLILLCIFLWKHRYTFLIFAENVNQAFDVIEVIKETYIGLFESLISSVEIKYLPG